MTLSEFQQELRERGYCYDGLVVTHQGDVDLSSITSLPEGVQFNNEGYVDLNSITKWDCENAGRRGRNIYVVNGSNFGLRVSLGCFIGTQQEALDAIDAAYTGHEAEAYKAKVNEAFENAAKRYQKLKQ